MQIKKNGVRILVKESPQVNFTLEDFQQQIDYRLLNLSKIHLGPVSLKRLHFTLVSSHQIRPLSNLSIDPFRVLFPRGT